MIYEFSNYQHYLRSQLAERIGNNPAYSLRTFAYELGLSAPTLSNLLRENKNLSRDRAFQVAQRLELNEAEIEYFLLMVDYALTRDPSQKSKILDRMEQAAGVPVVRELSVDRFQMIADWYHLAILEMTYLDGVDFSPETIANHLGITAVQAHAAIDRLVRLDLLEPTPGGRYRKTQDHLLFRSPAPNEAMRKHYKQILQLATEAVTHQSPTEKVIGTEVFAFDPELLPEAEKVISKCLSQLVVLSKKSKTRSHIYVVLAELFRVSKNSNQQEKIK